MRKEKISVEGDIRFGNYDVYRTLTIANKLPQSQLSLSFGIQSADDYSCCIYLQRRTGEPQRVVLFSDIYDLKLETDGLSFRVIGNDNLFVLSMDENERSETKIEKLYHIIINIQKNNDIQFKDFDEKKSKTRVFMTDKKRKKTTQRSNKENDQIYPQYGNENDSNDEFEIEKSKKRQTTRKPPKKKKKEQMNTLDSHGFDCQKLSDQEEEEQEQEQKIEKILNFDSKKNEYLVKWINSSSTTWEPKSKLNCENLIKEFNDEKKKEKKEIFIIEDEEETKEKRTLSFWDRELIKEQQNKIIDDTFDYEDETIKNSDDDYQPPVSSPIDDDFSFSGQITMDDYLPARRETRSSKKVYQEEEGFENLGNTCYMNSILFALSNLENFKKNLKNEKFDSNNEKYKIMSLLKKLIFNLKGNKCTELEDLKKIIEKKNNQFTGHSQQDAHEFLMTCCNFISEFDLGVECPIDLNFNFEVIKTFYCTKCKDSSIKEESFIDIILNLNEEKNVSNLLDSFFKTENLEKKCEKCNHRESTVTYEIKKLPKCFILQLKRFEPNIVNNEFIGLKKVKEEIEIMNQLDFEKFCKINVGEKEEIKNIFDLKSIIVHSGSSPNSGHYTCYIKNSDEIWYECNDNVITKQRKHEPVLKDKMIKKNAYILFYEINE
eukprot:gene4359-7715_t